MRVDNVIFHDVRVNMKLRAVISQISRPVIKECCACLSSSTVVKKQTVAPKKANYDLQYLNKLDKDILVYKILRLQRLVDSYHYISNPVNIDGRDKIRIEHPNPHEIISHMTSIRRIALKVCYLGWDYVGYAYENPAYEFARSDTISNVVERVLLEALLRQQLITGVGSGMNFDRAGRTDRLVSGLSQVVCVNVRSNLKKGYGVWLPKVSTASCEETSSKSQIKPETQYFEDEYSNSDTSLDVGEMPYVSLLNQALPPDIRILAWAPVKKLFSPRYGCKLRTYRYAFVRGSMDIRAMNEAAERFIGRHDFRNFCKKSVENVNRTFERTIFSFTVEELSRSNLPECDMCVATISAESFVYKQVRRMMSILGKIGSGELPPSIINDLLDVEKTPKIPSYKSWEPINLTLIDTDYDDTDIHWRWDEPALVDTSVTLANAYGKNAARAEVSRYMYDRVVSKLEDPGYKRAALLALNDSLLPPGEYGEQKLRYAPNTLTVEEKQEKYAKQKIRNKMRRGQYQFASALHTQQQEAEAKNNSNTPDLSTAKSEQR